MDPLAFLADRWYGRSRRRDETTPEAVQRGVHRLGFRRGYTAAVVSLLVVYSVTRLLAHVLGVA